MGQVAPPERLAVASQPVNMPVSFFSMAVGTLAWGYSWQAASRVWPLPTWLVTVASALGLWWARAPDEQLWQLLAPVLFGVANLVLAVLLWNTSKLFAQGRLLPPATQSNT